uniref:Ribosomal protein S3 n=1 Tax=Acanthamoeba polyphaga TaxID=5757 RepID=A0A0S0IMD0_ACAPO|nr:ribosomal protein S3 [Acanthamoeba polyphaga]
MGHVINPISYRLYNIRYWNNNWFSNNLNYSYLVNQDVLLDRFFRKLLTGHLGSTNVGIIFVNLKIIRFFDNISLYLYIHDSFLDLLFFNLKKNTRFVLIRRLFNKRFYKKYRKTLRLGKEFKKFKARLFIVLKKKVILKYSRKLFFLFIKNKILKIYWDNFKTLALFYLKKFSRLNFLSKIFVIGLSKMNVNANIISEFFFIRLTQYYTIWEVLRNINFLFKSLMKGKKLVKGYKITCSGRFSRKQRATYSWKAFGSLAFSTVKSKLDYSYKTIALKYSACTIKVWVRLGKKKTNLADFVI